MKRFFETNNSWGPLLGRVGLAVAMFPHGAQKLLGLFGGYGFNGTMQFFTQQMHIPAPLAALAIITEFFAPLALVLGLGTRLASAGIGIVIGVAAATVHVANGFFMNWSGKQAGEGFEYHILMFVLAAVLVVQGGGKFALDSLIARKLSRKSTESTATGVAAAHA